ncbi:uncharacterized protein EMH_0042580 [Eimeria mitis]|uniref:Uncharacterized protein n=1 Tax=Eimeria mitis TaxID=44415 RepID=U6JYN4_9EIME|nr:uncharacterized protein EMH_0042580 [Eimeria mitis]CDJ28638.1 hypothetical protein EMH_0042580 [Eimeria mitis]
MPTHFLFLLRAGPPLFPGFIAASIWIASSQQQPIEYCCKSVRDTTPCTPTAAPAAAAAAAAAAGGGGGGAAAAAGGAAAAAAAEAEETEIGLDVRVCGLWFVV